MTIFPVAVRSKVGLGAIPPDDQDSVELCGHERNAFIYHLDLDIVHDDSGETHSLPGMEVWFVDGPDLPVAGILGGSAMHDLVTVFRERERLFHIRPLKDFLHADCPHSNGRHPL